MQNIIEYRDDRAPANEYPRRIVSPTTPSPCCVERMERIGRSGIDANWRFYYKRCAVCGYTVRCFYAPSLLAILDATWQIKLALAEMNLGTGKRKRRTRAEIEAERAALGQAPQVQKIRRPLMPFRHRKPIPTAA
ncbi:MAG TPA: hypothetical protein VLT62_07695 [Candidatus Methylomirabilis sp.]|nr:hypothetical protein [Candidatus Methylomirabilis sp.]